MHLEAQILNFNYLMFSVVLGDSSHAFGRYLRNNDNRKPIDAPLDRANSYRFNDFLIHARHPTVIHLIVHLENGQRVYFHDKKCCLTCPSTLRKQNAHLSSDFTRTLLHNEAPQYYTLNNGNKTWQRQKQGQAVLEEAEIRSSDALGLMYTVHPIRNPKSS
ncbi:hypothetical protein AVEN_229044-1 [Araneus ventricosus]|uniref:Uncharacterized protein n=1 Tax=Araneus ventricosus TaxID=182803 RepID=A0A4Y2CY30_ARAVE|nr:hypothetical protein AVEN_229044-1 [Araneus ventricosus]